ncbi:MAG: DUF4136 domain-containing protein [Ignavibacteriaceae bacterium]|nr:DUF4136 domain-containing protein [Ignavibacteriaceae bacterium]
MKKYLVITVLLLGVIGCSSISTTSDYNPAADFVSYTTFSIYNGVIKDSKLESVPLAKKRVLEAIKKKMQKKGLTISDSSNASLIIFAHGGTAEKMNVTDYGYGYGGWWGPYPYGRNIDVSYYTEASLVIDFVDNAKDELIWRGIGTAALQDRGTPEERQAFIDEAVAKILDQYPPVE